MCQSLSDRIILHIRIKRGLAEFFLFMKKINFFVLFTLKL